MGNSSESTQQELSYEYQHDRVEAVLKNICTLCFWTKVASALEGLKGRGDMTRDLICRLVRPLYGCR